MVDIIILLIVLVIIIFAVKGTIKHFKGEGACCGGGSKGLIKTEEKKLQHPKIGEKTVKISGMHCEQQNRRRSRQSKLQKITGHRILRPSDLRRRHPERRQKSRLRSSRNYIIFH